MNVNPLKPLGCQLRQQVATVKAAKLKRTEIELSAVWEKALKFIDDLAAKSDLNNRLCQAAEQGKSSIEYLLPLSEEDNATLRTANYDQTNGLLNDLRSSNSYISLAVYCAHNNLNLECLFQYSSTASSFMIKLSWQ